MLRLATAAEFDLIYPIMEASFPKEERRTYEGQKALMEKPAYQIYVTRDETGEISAFLAAWMLEALVFIEHFAVHPEKRNGGLGASMLREFVALFSETICLEAELPSDSLTKRRIAFYERSGFHLNDYPYIQPALNPETAPVPLAVMTYDKAVDKTEFCRIREILYREVYQTSENTT